MVSVGALLADTLPLLSTGGPFTSGPWVHGIEVGRIVERTPAGMERALLERGSGTWTGVVSSRSNLEP
jgi:hypothetical protein